jgi:hypothetical protein
LPAARAGARVAAVVPLVRPRRTERVAALHGPDRSARLNRRHRCQRRRFPRGRMQGKEPCAAAFLRLRQGILGCQENVAFIGARRRTHQ